MKLKFFEEVKLFLKFSEITVVCVHLKGDFENILVFYVPRLVGEWM